MENNGNYDAWTFTDNIKVYKWESHPEQDLCPSDITGIWINQVNYYNRNREHLYSRM